MDTRDRTLAGLRGVALLAGVAWALLSPSAGGMRAVTLEAFAVFGSYSLVIYLGFFRLIRRAPGTFYGLAAAADLVFTLALIALTGGAASHFVRALYVWVAMLAFLFGLKLGTVGSLVAFASFLAFYARAGFAGDLWLLIVQAGGVLMHGPLIGFLTDRERARAEQLQRAGDRLAEANQRLVEEQAKLVQAEKLSSIGLLASGVAHEINNPLAGAMGCFKALREGNLSPERREEYHEAIRDGLERIRVAVQGLLDFSRQRPPMPADLDAGEVVGGCLRLLQPLQRKKDLQVENRVAPGHVQVRADRTQLMQALVNVLMNAIQAVPAKGHIVVSARQGEARVGLSVADDGAGIPKENLSRVTDPFFTTKPPGEGTGLGLAITLGIAKAHGGDLTIASEPGKGTEVTLWLPQQKERRLDA